ncbi:hypothetical protein E2C01_013763 [Portunus trituberculatus]|uniref:Uncharacterized protein n=1 Tax=Portunus trituberculatus TaxID=210409 RepID=A0A5B7DHY6_PORTR|nr:hypothetical protein [Portunus trituberculatus]
MRITLIPSMALSDSSEMLCSFSESSLLSLELTCYVCPTSLTLTILMKVIRMEGAQLGEDATSPPAPYHTHL